MAADASLQGQLQVGDVQPAIEFVADLGESRDFFESEGMLQGHARVLFGAHAADQDVVVEFSGATDESQR